MLKTIQNEFKALGTDIDIKIVLDKEKPETAKIFLEELKNLYSEKEKIFSRFNPESELSKINKNLGKYIEASCDIIEAAAKAIDYYKKTEGFFDPRIIDILESMGYDRNFKNINSVAVRPLRNNPRQVQVCNLNLEVSKSDKICKLLGVGQRSAPVPNIKQVQATAVIEPLQISLEEDLKIEKNKILFNHRMDFSGIAKGYITDRASEFLKSGGFQNFLIDSGGDIYASGTDEDNNSWNISIEGTDENKLSFNLSGRGIATSGITRRKWEGNGQKFHHLINPKKPREFSFDLKTVTVISENTEKADVWAKALFLMGKNRGLEYSGENGIASAFLDYRGNVYLSSKMKDYIAKSSS